MAIGDKFGHGGALLWSTFLFAVLSSVIPGVEAARSRGRGSSSLAKGALIAIIVVVVVAVIICAILIFCCMRILRRKKATKAPKDAVLPMTTTNEQAAYGQPTSYTPQPHPEYQQATQQPYGGGQQQYNAHQTEYNAVSSYGGQPQGAAGYAPPPGPPTFPVAPSGY